MACRRFFRFFMRFAAPVLIGAVAFLPLRAGEKDPDPHRFDEEITRFLEWDRQNSVPRNAALFAGSSSIRLWNTAESFPQFPVINRGFGGAHISDVLFFMEKIVLPYRPAAIVFYAGDNDIADGKSAEKVLADFRRFVERVRQALPETRIVFLPIKPSLARWNFWPEMKKANGLIETYCAGDERLFYADTAAPILAGGGKPGSELFLEDGLHLSAAGYRLWSEALKPALEKALAYDRKADRAIKNLE